jgi:hypothetical protein
MITTKNRYPVNEKTTFFLIPPTDPLLNEWRPNVEKYVSGIDTEGHTLHLVVSDENVKALSVSEVHNAFLVLQHYPHLLKNLIGNVSIDFQITGTDEYYEDYDWMSEEHIAWLHRMVNTFPLITLFIENRLQRFIGLMGDMILSNEHLLKRLLAKIDTEIKIPKDQMQVLDNRLFEACRYSLLYLHGSGTNPESYIKKLIKEHQMKFQYADLLEIYKEDIKNGDSFKLISICDN